MRPTLALVVVLVLAACSDGSDPVESNTPRIHSTFKELEPGLITAAQVEQAGLPPVRRVPDQDAPVFENPDPRGPCGAPIDQPDLSRGATVVFAGRGFVLTESIVELTEDRARTFMDAFLADATPGCGKFDSMTNQGVVQTVTPTVVDLPAVGDQRAGINSAFTTEGQTAHGGAVLVRRGTRVAFGVVFAGSPVADDVVRELAIQVDQSLARLKPRAPI